MEKSKMRRSMVFAMVLMMLMLGMVWCLPARAEGDSGIAATAVETGQEPATTSAATGDPDTAAAATTDAAAASATGTASPETSASSLGAALSPLTSSTTSNALEAQVTSGLPTNQGLVIDGDGLSTPTSLCIKTDTITGHAYNGKPALRYMALVYNKNSDGTYTPAGTFGDEDQFQTTWDIVQRDSSSNDNDDANLDWHDNRLMRVSVGQGQVAVVFAVSWDDTKDNWSWFPSANSGDQAREDYIKGAQPDTSDWSFSYQVAAYDTRSGYVSSCTCQGDAAGTVRDGAFVSSNPVRTGKLHTIVPKVTTVTAPAEYSTPVMTLKFDGLDGITEDEFNAAWAVFVKTPSHGLNGDRFGASPLLRIEWQVKDAQGESVGGGLCTASGSDRYATLIPPSYQMFEYMYPTLKDGGSVTLYAQDALYEFSYAIGAQAGGQAWTVGSVTDDATGEALKQDSITGLFTGDDKLQSGTDHTDVALTVHMAKQSVSSLGGDAQGLPNYGLRIVGDGGSTSSTPDLSLRIDVKVPSTLRNGESADELSHVRLCLDRYKKQTDGTYIRQGYDTDGIDCRFENGTATKLTSIMIDGDSLAGDDVYVLVPRTSSGDVPREFEFTYQVMGCRGGDSKVDGYDLAQGAVDPSGTGVTWSPVATEGAYDDCTPEQTLSSHSGGIQAQTLKVDASARTTDDTASLINGAGYSSCGLDSTITTGRENTVIIRNHADGYTSTDDADGMPDVQVTVSAPVSNDNTGAPLRWGADDDQLPYQAFLYTYNDDGTYTMVNFWSETNGDCYHKCDDSDGSILWGSDASGYYDVYGPAHVTWGVKPGGTSTFHTHLLDNQAIVLVPRASTYRFSYQVSVKNHDKYSVKSYTVDGSSLSQTADNLYQSGNFASYASDANGLAKTQEVVLTTAKTTADDQTMKPLSESLSASQSMRTLPVTLFDYDFPGLTKTDYSAQTAQYKFLLDPVNHYDAPVNHIGSDVTRVFTGIVGDELGSDGLPTFDYTTPFSLFDSTAVTDETNGGTKTVDPAGFQFVYDEDTATYSYNSHFHHAQLEDDGVIREYDHSLGLAGWGRKSAGFFPYDNWQDAMAAGEGTWGSAADDTDSTYLLSESNLDYHFGMSMNQSFTVPEGGTVKGSDMIFSFSGDDDVWVFVDGKLVLDMGGIHEAVPGSIDFTKGTYSVNGVTHDLSDVLGDLSGFGGTDGDWAAGTSHTFALYYLERGGTLSNLDISFNLPVARTSATWTPKVSKTVEGATTTTDGTYSFSIKAAADNPAEVTLPDDLELTVPAGTTHAENGSFNGITFSEPGTYHFDITEAEGKDVGVAYSIDTWTATVPVSYVDGKLTVGDVTYAKGEGDQQVTDTVAAFINTYWMPSYTVSKVRIDDASAKDGGTGYGFRHGDTVVYEAVIANTGNVDLVMDVADVFADASYFSAPSCVSVTGDGTAWENEDASKGTSTLATISVAAGKTATVSFTATVSDTAPESLASTAADDGSGYANTVTISGVKGSYVDASGATVTMDKDTTYVDADGRSFHPLADASASAHTPVQVGTDNPASPSGPDVPDSPTSSTTPTSSASGNGGPGTSGGTTSATIPRTGDSSTALPMSLLALGLFVAGAGVLGRRLRS